MSQFSLASLVAGKPGIGATGRKMMASIKALLFQQLFLSPLLWQFVLFLQRPFFTLCPVGCCGVLKTVLQLLTLLKHECGKCIFLSVNTQQLICLTTERFFDQSTLHSNSTAALSSPKQDEEREG